MAERREALAKWFNENLDTAYRTMDDEELADAVLEVLAEVEPRHFLVEAQSPVKMACGFDPPPDTEFSVTTAEDSVTCPRCKEVLGG